MCLLNSYKI